VNAAAPTLMQNRWGFIAFMAVICSLSPFAMSFPVPAFPAMAEVFDKPVAEIQLLISAFLIGLGVAQPVHGVLADRYGRRPVLLVGFVIFILASIASVLTTSWTALVACRFLQAVGVSAGTVTSRAIVNDAQPREEAAITLSYISIAMGVGPIIAPVLGGLLSETLGWRSIFIGCSLAGIVVLALAFGGLPETRPRNKANDKTFGSVVSDYRTLLSSPQFLGYTMMFGFGQGIFFAFLPFGPDYFENVLGESTSVFVICWIALSLAFMAGSLGGTRLVRRLGMDKTVLGASLWLIFACGLIALVYRIFGDHVLSLTIPMMVAMLATGIICPLALTGSISSNPKMAGAASGLSSSLGLIIGGGFAVVSGLIYDGTLKPYIALAALSVLGNLIAVGMTRLGDTENRG
jgi:DHA1 family bicyclomycin/chloramphenicol resistance-like MFS transporter